MKRFIPVFYICLLSALTVHAQDHYKEQIDSLKLKLTVTGNDSMRLVIVRAILAAYYQYKPEEGLLYKEEALQLAVKSGKKQDLAHVKEIIGRLYWRSGKFKEAYPFHFEALQLYIATGDISSRNAVLIEIGQDYLNDTRFEEARKYLLQALQSSTESKDTANILRTHDILIALYENLGDYTNSSRSTYAYLKVSDGLTDKKIKAHAASLVAEDMQNQENSAEALNWYQKSLQLNLETGNKIEAIHIYRSIGDINLQLGRFSDAAKSYQDGMQICAGLEGAALYMPVLTRAIGNMYRTENKYSDALYYLLWAASDLKSTASNHPLATLYSEIGTVYTRNGEFGKAQKYFDSSMALCRNLNTKTPLQDYYLGKQLLDSAMGNWKAAFEDNRMYEQIKDSAVNKDVLRKMLQSRVQFENDKKDAAARAEQEKKDLLTEGEIRQQRKIRNYALGVLAVLLLFSGIVYVQRNRIARAKKRSDQLLKQNELLLREIHHRVKNNLEVVSSLLALQSAQIEDANTREAMEEGQNRVHSISIVHQKLYQGDNPGSIEMKDYFISLGETILDSFGAADKVKIICEMDPVELDIDLAVPLGLIMNELLTNTLKYAFPGGQTGVVTIRMQRKTGGGFSLEVSDNGIGKSGLVQGTGFGSQLISLLTRQLNGTIREENRNGTQVFFDFKPHKGG